MLSKLFKRFKTPSTEVAGLHPIIDQAVPISEVQEHRVPVFTNNPYDARVFEHTVIGVVNRISAVINVCGLSTEIRSGGFSNTWADPKVLEYVRHTLKLQGFKVGPVKEWEDGLDPSDYTMLVSWGSTFQRISHQETAGKGYVWQQSPMEQADEKLKATVRSSFREHINSIYPKVDLEVDQNVIDGSPEQFVNPKTQRLYRLFRIAYIVGRQNS